MSVLDIQRIARNWEPLIVAADAALEALAQGSCEAPMRSSLALSRGSLLTMSGRLSASDSAVVKVVSAIPTNSVEGRPAIQGLAVMFDVDTGAPIVFLDGAMLTLIRTAAVSAAATRRLAPATARTLAMLGTGAQARWHVHALASVLPIDKVTIWSPRPASRENLAHQLEGEIHADIQPVESAIEATRNAEVICCATTARTAFLHDNMLSRERVHVVAIGAFRRDMAEIGPSVFRRAGGVFVERVEDALHEAGDVINTIDEGLLTENDLVPIGNVTSEEYDILGSELTLFKSVGNAVEDAAVAEVLYQEWKR